MRYFTSGRFEWRVPLLGVTLAFDDPAAVGAIDWWGVNYYTRCAAADHRLGLSGGIPVFLCARHEALESFSIQLMHPSSPLNPPPLRAASASTGASAPAA